MTHSCEDCGRPNAAHRSACIYCGGVLPEPTEKPPEQVSLPADIDRLVRQAMTLGTTTNLSKALADHQDRADEDTPVLKEHEDDTPPVRALLDAATAAADAEAEGDRSALSQALNAASAALDRCGPLRTLQPKDVSDSVSEAVTDLPTILLPKVRRPFALVMEGLGDVERHHELVKALEIDAVTARMLAIARQPRVALRSEDSARLHTMAQILTETLNIAATVVDSDTLRSHGPAHLLVSWTGGPKSIPVPNWQADLQRSASAEQATPITTAPVLVVPGEVVILKYRPARVGGRLKHLRESRIEPGAELRRATADLHMPSGIYRVLEGVTDLSDAPAAVADGFRRSLRALIEQWANHGARVLEARTCAPAMDSTPVHAENQTNMVQTGWPEWEEHSRCVRSLFMGDTPANEVT